MIVMRQLADNIRILLADAPGTDDKMRPFVRPQDFESGRVVEAYCIDVFLEALQAVVQHWSLARR